MRTRVTLTLLLGIAQSFIAFSAMALAAILYFDFFEVHTLWNISQEALNFHLAILLTFGVFLIGSGLFLVNEWREIH